MRLSTLYEDFLVRYLFIKLFVFLIWLMVTLTLVLPQLQQEWESMRLSLYKSLIVCINLWSNWMIFLEIRTPTKSALKNKISTIDPLPIDSREFFLFCRIKCIMWYMKAAAWITTITTIFSWDRTATMLAKEKYVRNNEYPRIYPLPDCIWE